MPKTKKQSTKFSRLAMRITLKFEKWCVENIGTTHQTHDGIHFFTADQLDEICEQTERELKCQQKRSQRQAGSFGNRPEEFDHSNPTCAEHCDPRDRT